MTDRRSKMASAQGHGLASNPLAVSEKPVTVRGGQDAICMSIISHQYSDPSRINAPITSSAPSRTIPPSAPSRTIPPSTPSRATQQVKTPKPASPKYYLPLSDSRLRIPWIELGCGVACAFLSLSLIIGGLSQGSVIGKESLGSRNYGAVYAGVVFLLITIALFVVFGFHFTYVRRTHGHSQCVDAPDSSPQTAGRRQSYMAENFAYSEDENRTHGAALHVKQPPTTHGERIQSNVNTTNVQTLNSFSSIPQSQRQKMVSHNSTLRDEIRMGDGSQAPPSQVRGAAGYGVGPPGQGRMGDGSQVPPSQVRGATGYGVGPQGQGRMGDGSQVPPSQVRGATGYGVGLHGQGRMGDGSQVPPSQVRGAAGYGSSVQDTKVKERPPPTYADGSEHSSPPPSYHTFMDSSFHSNTAQSPELSTTQQQAIIERRQQRLATSKSASSSQKADIHRHT